MQERVDLIDQKQTADAQREGSRAARVWEQVTLKRQASNVGEGDWEG